MDSEHGSVSGAVALDILDDKVLRICLYPDRDVQAALDRPDVELSRVTPMEEGTLISGGCGSGDGPGR